jgi:hypothetical protein
MLDRPHVVNAEAIGQLDMLERLAEHSRLLTVSMRSGQLDFVEDAELHVVMLSAARPDAPNRRAG